MDNKHCPLCAVCRINPPAVEIKNTILSGSTYVFYFLKIRDDQIFFKKNLPNIKIWNIGILYPNILGTM